MTITLPDALLPWVTTLVLALLVVGMLSVMVVLWWYMRTLVEVCRLARLLEIRLVQLLLMTEHQPQARRELIQELRSLMGRDSYF